jgi:hypothetical protein
MGARDKLVRESRRTPRKGVVVMHRTHACCEAVFSVNQGLDRGGRDGRRTPELAVAAADRFRTSDKRFQSKHNIRRP